MSRLGRRYNSDRHDKSNSASRELAKKPKQCIEKSQAAVDAGAR